MAFPTNPTDGQTTIKNSVSYTYNSTKGAWVKSGAMATASPVSSVAGRTGAVTLTYADISSGTPPTLPWATQITGQAVINTTTPGTGTYGLHFTGQTTADNAAGITWNGGTGTIGAQAGIYVQGSGSYGTKMYLATTDNYATGAKTAISIDHTGAVVLNRGALTVAGGVSATSGTFSSTLGVSGTITSGGLTTANGDFAIVNTTSGTSAWSNRTGVKNAAADKAVFLGTYDSTAIVGAHNNALNAWADLYINTTGDSLAGTTHIGGAQIVSLGIGTPASGTTGEIRATNAITAYYSDRRLKTETGKIENALDKIDQLCGVLYTQNKLAEEFGYNNYEEQVGLYAQDVNKVQPQAVKPAPFDIAADGTSKSGENYLTVQYEKLVPLLVEGIKELRVEINKLKGM